MDRCDLTPCGLPIKDEPTCEKCLRNVSPSGIHIIPVKMFVNGQLTGCSGEVKDDN